VQSFVDFVGRFASGLFKALKTRRVVLLGKHRRPEFCVNKFAFLECASIFRKMDQCLTSKVTLVKNLRRNKKLAA